MIRSEADFMFFGKYGVVITAALSDMFQNGNLLVIQAEPFRRPGVEYAIGAPYSTYSEEGRAYLHLLEVIQTMLDTLVYDGEKNWAHLVRQKDNTYRLIYTTKRFVQKCSIWTKVDFCFTFVTVITQA